MSQMGTRDWPLISLKSTFSNVDHYVFSLAKSVLIPLLSILIYKNAIQCFLIYEFKSLCVPMTKSLRQLRNLVAYDCKQETWQDSGVLNIMRSLLIFKSVLLEAISTWTVNHLPRSSSKISPFRKFHTHLLSENYTSFSGFHLDHTILNRKDRIINAFTYFMILSTMPCQVSANSGGEERARVPAQLPCLLDCTLHPSLTKRKPFVSLVIKTMVCCAGKKMSSGVGAESPSWLLCSMIAPWS